MGDGDLVVFYDERLAEINEYLGFLHDVDIAVQSGTPKIMGLSDSAITTSLHKILFSNLYLQLYNLVEATVSRFIEAIGTAATVENTVPKDLSGAMRSEWVRTIARTHKDMSAEKRLEYAMLLFDHLIGELPVINFQVEVGGGGNWDDEAIEKFSKRIGCDLHFDAAVKELVRAPLRDNMGALKLVKKRRNSLAHGNISFVDCADGVTLGELERLVEAVGTYLREAILAFSSYLDSCGFLDSTRQPA